MAQSITLQSQSMTAQVEKQGFPMENPPASTMAKSLGDFTRMNSPIYTGSMIDEDLKEECGEAMLHDSMGLSRLKLHVQQVEKQRRGSTQG